MTNPAQAIRMLITYAIIIPLAALVGWMVCNQFDFGTLGFFALLGVLLASPIFIKWHYPLLLFGLGCPMVCFFLPGVPPLWQVAVMLSLGLSIVERTLNSDRRFISVPVMTWPLLFTVAMAYMTAKLTGGIGLHQLGGSLGGGKKYLAMFLGIACYFAITSRKIPKEKRGLYIALVFLAGAPAVLSDLFPVLPSPLNYINLLFPPSEASSSEANGISAFRLAALGGTAGTFLNYMVARYGLRGILWGPPWRLFAALLLFPLTLWGGFRIVLIGMIMTYGLLFYLEGLHRTRLMPAVVMGGILALAVILPFAKDLPIPIQRSISFLPVKVDPQVQIDADSSKVWRETMWRDVWPKVPQYLLLGKGYALHEEDFQYMGNGTFANMGNNFDASAQGLAVSMDYHNGPLSTLMPFGIWGAISYLWLVAAALYIVVCNYRYGDEELKTVNRFWLVFTINSIIGFFVLFGAYSDSVGSIARIAGFSVAFNWGICRPKVAARTSQVIRRLPRPAVTAPV